ncbi:MAG: cell division protein ZapA [Alphaproteobacteria bacterium]|jgi:cell division protein ZapA (FtsZ GTPase activity inhibitor)|nr:cell division protein ZapA [Alphaproteobacteria bacterium]
MNSVDVTINGKLYKIGCLEETVEDIKKYAAELDGRIHSLKLENPTSFMSLSQETLFLFEALSLISELKEVKESKNQDYNLEIAELNNKIKKLSQTIDSLQKVVKNF